jgi:hypothetical protein
VITAGDAARAQAREIAIRQPRHAACSMSRRHVSRSNGQPAARRTHCWSNTSGGDVVSAVFDRSRDRAVITRERTTIT